MDTRPIKPEDNKGGTFTQQLTSGEVTTAYVSPVPAEAPGVITAEPGTAKEEAIFFRTRDAGAGTIGGLIRDYTNLNGGVGHQHENGEDWEVFQSAFYIKNLVDIILEGFFYEMAVIARTGSTTFTVVGNKAIFYTAGRLLRCNEDSNEIVTVVSSSYSAGTGLTTVTISGTLPDPLTDIELGIQPKTAAYQAVGETILDSNGNEVMKIPATVDAVNELTIRNASTNNPPSVEATGDDTNIDLKFVPKGSGALTVPAGTYEDNVTDDDDIPNKKYVDDHGSPADGWTADANTWTYASADDPTFTLTVNADLTGKIGVGDRIKLTQTTAKYFIVTAISYSSPNTTITLFGGTDYDLANAAITLPHYSHMKAPLGFPLSPVKWTVETTDNQDRTQGSPTNFTWYNIASISLSIPIGVWNVSYYANAYTVKGSAGVDMWTTLSTANNSESDTDLTSLEYAMTTALQTGLSKSKVLTLASKTSYYLNHKTANGVTSINLQGSQTKTYIRAVSAYL